MWLLLVPLKPRYMLLCIALLGFAAVIAGALRYPNQASLFAAPLAFFAFFAILGLRDFFQTRHAILRNYPITAHLRFLFEKIRPEMRQYFFEDDKTDCRFRGTSGPSCTNAPRAPSTSVRSAPNTMSTNRTMSGCTIRWPPSRRRGSRSALP